MAATISKMTISFGGGRRGPQTPPPGQAPQAAPAGYGLILNTAPDEFVFLGTGISASFAADSSGPKIAVIGTVDEGRFEQGVWIPGRRLNGDEGGGRVQMRGPGIGILKVKVYRHD